MDNTDYCSYELAVKLKECGFDWPAHNGYSQKLRIEPVISFGEPKMVHSKTPKNFNDNRKGISEGLDFYSAPLLSQAQKWLREKHNIHVLPHLESVNRPQYVCYITRLHKSRKRLTDDARYFDTYESALSSGISAALEMIGKEV